eukprot:11216693-Ditylum_brightwellii.AAC.1
MEKWRAYFEEKQCKHTDKQIEAVERKLQLQSKMIADEIETNQQAITELLMTLNSTIGSIEARFKSMPNKTTENPQK